MVRKLPSEIFPEYFLIRVNEFNKVAVTPLEEWMLYLKTGFISEQTTAPGLQEARQKLIYYSMSVAEQQAYDEHLNNVMIENGMLDSAKVEGREEGRAEGRAEGVKEVAANLKKMGVPVEVIIQSTGLSEKEVNDLEA